MVEQQLNILVFRFLLVRLKKCFWILLPELKQNQGKLKKKTMVIGVRICGKEKRTDKGSLLDVITEVPRYLPEFGGGEVGNDKHVLGRVPSEHIYFTLVCSSWGTNLHLVS